MIKNKENQNSNTGGQFNSGQLLRAAQQGEQGLVYRPFPRYPDAYSVSQYFVENGKNLGSLALYKTVEEYVCCRDWYYRENDVVEVDSDKSRVYASGTYVYELAQEGANNFKFLCERLIEKKETREELLSRQDEIIKRRKPQEMHKLVGAYLDSIKKNEEDLQPYLMLAGIAANYEKYEGLRKLAEKMVTLRDKWGNNDEKGKKMGLIVDLMVANLKLKHYMLEEVGEMSQLEGIRGVLKAFGVDVEVFCKEALQRKALEDDKKMEEEFVIMEREENIKEEESLPVRVDVKTLEKKMEEEDWKEREEIERAIDKIQGGPKQEEQQEEQKVAVEEKRQEPVVEHPEIDLELLKKSVNALEDFKKLNNEFEKKEYEQKLEQVVNEQAKRENENEEENMEQVILEEIEKRQEEEKKVEKNEDSTDNHDEAKEQNPKNLIPKKKKKKNRNKQ